MNGQYLDCQYLKNNSRIISQRTGPSNDWKWRPNQSCLEQILSAEIKYWFPAICPCYYAIVFNHFQGQTLTLNNFEYILQNFTYKKTYVQIDRHADRYADGHTTLQTEIQIDIQPYRKNYSQTYWHIDRHTDRHTFRHTNWYTDKLMDIKRIRDRHTDR